MKMIRKDYTAFLGRRLVSALIFQGTWRYKFIVCLLKIVKRIEGCRPFPGLDLFLLLQLMLSTHTEKVLYSHWLFITRSAKDCEHSLYRPVKDTFTINAWSNASWLCSLLSIQVYLLVLKKKNSQEEQSRRRDEFWGEKDVYDDETVGRSLLSFLWFVSFALSKKTGCWTETTNGKIPKQQIPFLFSSEVIEWMYKNSPVSLFLLCLWLHVLRLTTDWIGILSSLLSQWFLWISSWDCWVSETASKCFYNCLSFSKSLPGLQLHPFFSFFTTGYIMLSCPLFARDEEDEERRETGHETRDEKWRYLMLLLIAIELERINWERSGYIDRCPLFQEREREKQDLRQNLQPDAAAVHVVDVELPGILAWTWVNTAR